MPAPGQGTLALEIRADDHHTRASIDSLNHAPTFAALRAERAAVRVLEASCHTPVGIHAQDGTIRGFVGLPDGSAWVADEVAGEDGEELARRMLAAGAGERARARRRRSAVGGGANVFLVGAGPGDPGLLTLRAVELLGSADVVLYDRLIPPGALRHARPEAELVYVGKQGGGPQMPQEEIDRLLVEHGRSGKRVVRLKGGDPLVFGRGGEEALRLREAGIEFEIVPGITAGVAAPAYAGIPVTHRELASGVAFVTGHEDPDKPESALDWAALARFPGTLVFYMGVRALPRIAEKLQAEGRSAARAGGGDRARHAARPAHARRDARRRRAARADGRHPRAGGDARRAGRRPARGPGLARAPPAARQDGGGHPRPGAGEPARGAAARPRRRRDRGARHPHAVAARGAPRARRLRPARRVEPQRRARALRAPRGTRGSWPACAWPRWAPAPRGR